MPINPHNPFKGRQFPGEVILLCVRWYLRYPLSYEHVTELVAERGVEVDASCIWRWVQAYAPELNKRCRPHLKPTNKSYRIDETYIKVRGEDKYLYRALDSTGQTIDFLLTAKRDAAAAKRFLRRAIDASGNPMPRSSWIASWPGIIGSQPNRRLAKHLLHERPCLFTFLYCPGLVDATNNLAERVMRTLVMIRKNWGGNRTENGARAQAVLTSVLCTARQQDKDVFDLLVDLLRSRQPKLLDILPRKSGTVAESTEADSVA